MANWVLKRFGLWVEPFVPLEGDPLWVVTDGWLPLRIGRSYGGCVLWAAKRIAKRAKLAG